MNAYIKYFNKYILMYKRLLNNYRTVEEEYDFEDLKYYHKDEK